MSVYIKRRNLILKFILLFIIENIIKNIYACQDNLAGPKSDFELELEANPFILFIFIKYIFVIYAIFVIQHTINHQ